MRPAIVMLLLASVLAGCQSSESGFYDQRAKDEAVRAARTGSLARQTDVSVGSAQERQTCPQAPSPKAGPCLNVVVTSEVPARDMSGKEVGLEVQTRWDFFVWLKKSADGSWKVTHSSFRPKGAAVNGREYIPDQ